MAKSKRKHKKGEVKAAYEAAQVSPYEPKRTTQRSVGDANASVLGGQRTLRDRARWLDENYDLASGVLDTLTTWTVGARGISFEPQPRTVDGEIHQEAADAIRDYWERWSYRPEASEQYTRAELEQLLCRSGDRDGEAFLLTLNRPSKSIPGLDFVVHALESDYCPMTLDTASGDYYQGVKRNRWGKPTEYLFYDRHPGALIQQPQYRAVSASQVLHLKTAKRLEQVRGVSIFSTVMDRFADLKDYEESERIAARIAAAMTAAIEKGSPDLYDSDNEEKEPRQFDIEHGIVFDNLRVGEKVNIIQGNRPNPELINFRSAMLKAISGGTGAGSSTISKNYDGSYSAQRQELVEQFAIYNMRTARFVSQITMPMARAFIGRLFANRLVPIDGLDLASIYDGEFKGPVMPWVDPVKEAQANLIQVQAGFKTLSQVHRERGLDPAQVIREADMERQRIADLGLNFNSILGASNDETMV